jgi:signal peptidase II
MREGSGYWTRWLALSAVVLAADLATKVWVTRAFAPGDVITVTPFFNLVLVYNTGAAFSFLANAGGWQRWFFMVVSAVVSVVIVWLLSRHHRDRLMACALALVLGGALGNLYDRVTLGKVVDFVQLHAAGYYWPAFNIADSAISVGVVLLVWDSIREGLAARGAKRQQP